MLHLLNMDTNTLIVKSKMLPPPEWLAYIASQIPSTVVGTKATLHEDFGSGYFKYEDVQPGLTYNITDLTFKVPVRYQRLPLDNNDRFSIIMVLSRTSYYSTRHSKKVEFGLDKPNGAMIFSPRVTSSIDVPPNQRIFVIGIQMERWWCEQNLLDVTDTENLQAFLDSKEAVAMYENIDESQIHIIDEMLSSIEKGKIHTQSSLLRFISYLSDKISKRQAGAVLGSFKENDAKSIIRSCKLIENNLDKFVGIEEIARLAGMSESKFKKLFKSITGKSAYQYFLEHKFRKAEELLKERKYSVSEVGYLCGYTNLSHFSRQFKKYRNRLPSKV